tara:strand:+ start:1958 stop:2374 length:417 start_codon:yes stop_codon:yes gene_type:complete
MASSHGLYFIRDLTISSTSTGLYDVNGNKLSSANIIGSGNYAYSKAIELSPKSIEHILTATCQGCTVEIKLELSPDGVNWCPCILSSGSTCEFECTAAVGDCTTQTVDVPVLQFARIRIGNAGSTGGSCNVLLNFTLN